MGWRSGARTRPRPEEEEEEEEGDDVDVGGARGGERRNFVVRENCAPPRSQFQTRGVGRADGRGRSRLSLDVSVASHLVTAETWKLPNRGSPTFRSWRFLCIVRYSQLFLLC